MKRSLVKVALPLSLLGLLFCSLLFAPANTTSVSATQRPKYNVLFIISDDLRPELGSYGNPIIKTPNIDSLAARGTRFNHASAQFPLYNPARSTLFNGRYPTQTGLMDNNTYFRAQDPESVALPQYFQKNGDSTLRTGK